MRIRHGTFHMKYCTVICITRQKYKVEQLPVLWNMENKSRQNFCLASCITLVDVHQSTRVLQVYDHNRKSVAFSQVFRWKQNLHEKFSFRFSKVSIHSFIFWFFCTNAERFEWEKIMLMCKYCQPYYSQAPTFAAGLVKISDCKPGWLLVKNP